VRVACCANLDLGGLARVWQRFEDLDVNVLSIGNSNFYLVNHTSDNLRGEVHNFELLESVSAGLRFHFAS